MPLLLAMAMKRVNCYGLQFHPEVTHTTQGIRILERFVFDICAVSTQLDIRKILLKNQIAKIREQVGNEQCY